MGRIYAAENKWDSWVVIIWFMYKWANSNLFSRKNILVLLSNCLLDYLYLQPVLLKYSLWSDITILFNLSPAALMLRRKLKTRKSAIYAQSSRLQYYIWSIGNMLTGLISLSLSSPWKIGLVQKNGSVHFCYHLVLFSHSWPLPVEKQFHFIYLIYSLIHSFIQKTV